MSDDVIQAYKAARGPIPKEMIAWPLYGTGLENLGREGRPVRLPVPQHGPDQLLARIDAVGLCFSDMKILTLGGDHPRLGGRDLARDPVIMGHEVAVTIVRVGEQLQGQFQPGDRFVIQADIYYKGKGVAFGYRLPGALEQYVVIGKEILEGDEGPYLLAVQPDTGYAEAALSEPWACVECSYRAQQRDGLKPDGRVWIVGAPGFEQKGLELGAGIAEGPAVSEILLTNVAPAVADLWRAVAEQWGAQLETWDAEPAAFAGVVEGGHLSAQPDDIIVLGSTSADTVEALVPLLGTGGHLAIIGEGALPRKIELDVGRIHYDDLHYVGTTSRVIADAYRIARASEPIAGGKALYVGAGGPMGQMHVLRAIDSPAGPATVVATDMDEDRLATIPERFGPAAADQGVELICLNPQVLGPEEYERRLTEIAPEGFDDVVCLVPVSAVVADAASRVGPNGVLNIFAGAARGTMAQLDLTPVFQQGVRFIGTSGSSTSDLEFTLHKTERGELSPNRSVAAIGSLEAGLDGLTAVRDRTLAGKIVLYPQIEELPLTKLEQLRDVLPTVADKLAPPGIWTNEAELELLRQKLPKLGHNPGPFAVKRLAGKVALVTGGSQGLGRALAERLAQEGAEVCICDINGEGARQAAAEIAQTTGRKSLGIEVDVTNFEQMQAAVEQTVEACGKLDILISNAGILIAGAIDEFDVAAWRKVIEVNLVGYFIAAKAAVPELIQQKGVIVQINSKSGKKGSFKNSAYATSKFGGIGLTQSLALELAPLGVRVNAVCPGNLLDSPLWVDSLYEQYSKRWGISQEEVRKKYEEQVPLGRGCTYEDVANVVVFLASDESAYMTGQAINVTGGQEMR